MLKRLKNRSEFLRVARTRRKSVAPGLVLQVRRHDRDNDVAGGDAEAQDAFRVGFTVSRKVGNAVIRNRARRRLREVAEQVMPAHAKGGSDYVVIGRAATTRRPFGALVNDLENALKGVDAYRETATVDERRNGA